jgi:hypothetical protein
MSKLPKDLFDALKNSQAKTEFNDSFTKVTDFTPKKKPTLKERIKKSVTNLFSKLKKSKLVLTIKNWWFNNIKNPIRQKRAKKERENYVKELKANFAKKFNVDVEKTIRVMNHPNYSPYEVDNDRLLVENRLDINKRKSLYKFAPFIYEPEIVDVHNENLNTNNPPINEIINSDDDKSRNELTKQENFLKKRPHLTVGGRKRK